VLCQWGGSNKSEHWKHQHSRQTRTQAHDHHEVRWARSGKGQRASRIKNTVTTKVVARHSSHITRFRQFPGCDTDFYWFPECETHSHALSHTHTHAHALAHELFVGLFILLTKIQNSRVSRGEQQRPPIILPTLTHTYIHAHAHTKTHQVTIFMTPE